MANYLDMICIDEFSKRFPGFQAFQIKKGKTFTLSVRYENNGEDITSYNNASPKIDSKMKREMGEWLAQKYPRSMASKTEYPAK